MLSLGVIISSVIVSQNPARPATREGGSCERTFLLFYFGEYSMSKSFQTYDQQLAILKQKELTIPHMDIANDAFIRIGYFQLIDGYKYLFKVSSTKQYKPAASFDDILALYSFDEELRLVFLGQLLYIERAIKVQVAYNFCKVYGESQQAYLDPNNYQVSRRNSRQINTLIEKLNDLANGQTDYPYIKHHQQVYHNVPLWVLVNALTFGNISKMFELIPQSMQAEICKNYPLNIAQMKRLLSVLTKYRNACAHSERLFSYTIRESIPDLTLHKKLGIPLIGTQYCQGKHDLFAIVIAFRYLLPKDRYRNFKDSVSKLIRKFVTHNTLLSEQQLLDEMGFPINWHNITRYRVI